MAGTVVVLGAGATKSCGGPLTGEILPGMAARFQGSPEPWPELFHFLRHVFHVPPNASGDAYPGLPLLMSLLDTALDRNQAFQAGWPVERLARLRQCIERGIYDLLELQLNSAPTSLQYQLLEKCYPAVMPPAAQMPQVISMNYDLLIDTAMVSYSERIGHEGAFPNYCCDIQTEAYRSDVPKCGTLLKLHGSLNWLYCSSCQRLELGASESKRYLKAVSRLLTSANAKTLENAYLPVGSPCGTCQSELRPLLVAPSHLKDYRNPHLAQVWYNAERVLRQADRVIFVGYSLPEDDVEVVYLFKRCLAHLPSAQITVVECDEERRQAVSHPVGRRYRSLFGEGIDWHTEGMALWLASLPVMPSPILGVSAGA